MSFVYTPIATDDPRAASAGSGVVMNGASMNTQNGAWLRLRHLSKGGLRSSRDVWTSVSAVKSQLFMLLCYVLAIAILFSLRAPAAQLPVWEFQYHPTRISNSFQFEWLTIGYTVPMMLYNLYCIAYGVEYKWLIKAETNFMRWLAYAFSFPFQIAQLCFVSGMTDINGVLAMSALAFCHVLLYSIYDYDVVHASEAAFFKAQIDTTEEPLDEAEKKEQVVVTHQKHAKLFIACLSIVPWLIMWYILFRNGSHLREEGIVHEEWIIFSVIIVMVLSCFQVFNLLLFREKQNNGTANTSFLFRWLESTDEQVGGAIIRRKIVRERVFQFLCFASQVIQAFIIFSGTKENSIVLGGLRKQPFQNLGCLFE